MISLIAVLELHKLIVDCSPDVFRENFRPNSFLDNLRLQN
jgi:hypothetical protein